jgi:CheY-like chemotaxis protein
MSKLAKDVYSVLVADDSDADRFLLKAALQQTPRLQIIGEVADGVETIAYLEKHAELHSRKTFPFLDLLLLDLKMPLKDGFEVLEWLQTQSFGNLTVVVLTDSMQPEHIKYAMDLGADLFQVKPRTTHDREAMVVALEEYLTSSTPMFRRELPLAHLRMAHQPGARIY